MGFGGLRSLHPPMVTIINSTSTISCCDLKSRREKEWILRRGSHRGRNLRHSVSRLAPRGSFFSFLIYSVSGTQFIAWMIYTIPVYRDDTRSSSPEHANGSLFFLFFFLFFFRFLVCLLHSTGSKLGRHLRNLSRHLSCMYIYTFFLYIHIRIYSF